MLEQIIKIGQPVPINGILSEPESSIESSSCVIILNSGLMHHTGTCRFSVKLARELAKKDIASLRFDFPGRGDSAAVRDRVDSQATSVEEIQLIMNQLEQQNGFNRFILYGLCSGAYDSYHTALADKRIVGIAQIDPYVYRTSGWYWHHYLSRLFGWTQWFDMLKDKIPWIDAIPNKRVISEQVSLSVSTPPKEKVVHGYNQLIAAGTQVLIVITDGASYALNRKNQLFKMYAAVNWRNQMDYIYFPECSHIITEPEYQQKIKTIISDWVVKTLR